MEESTYHTLNIRVTKGLKGALIARAKQLRIKPSELARFAIAEKLAGYDATSPLLEMDSLTHETIAIDDDDE